ncbi:MAG: non-hydrolyzing UDP-N-acetylglucosamine 2-epimerase [Egibacteraceae bacterium]
MQTLIAHVVGARPNFMKAAPVFQACEDKGLSQVLVHTGQHYGGAMSDIFFRELALPKPAVNLGIGSGSHAAQTAALLIGLEQTFDDLRPGMVVVYGDVNSTLAAALVASKMHLPLAHVEAGLRSFDMTMPEEVNRRITDALSDILFVTSPEGVGHLAREGCAAERIHLVGNPMIDTLLANLGNLHPERVRRLLGLAEDYAVVTLHRPSNVDDAEVAAYAVSVCEKVSKLIPLVIPLHPRGRAVLESVGLGASGHVRLLEPMGYLNFLSLVRSSRLVITDSGGVQEETTVLGVPCLTVRSTTERPITITHGTNQLVGWDDIVACVEDILGGKTQLPTKRPPLWDGQAGRRIADILVDTGPLLPMTPATGH